MFFRPWNNNIFVLQMMVNAFFKYADSLILYSNKSMALTFFFILNKLKINHFKYLEKVSELFTTLSQFLSLK